MRMPGAKLRLQADLKRGFLNPFMQLKKMRMRLANADPNDFHHTLGWKRPNVFYRQKKWAKFNRT